MLRVRDIMTTTVVTVEPSTPFPDLVDTMLRHGVSGLPVVDGEGALVGMVTEADLVSKEAFGGTRRRALDVLVDLFAGSQSVWVGKARGLTAAEVMTHPVRTAASHDEIRVAARKMVESGVKRLPVVDDGRLVGVVSRTDLLRVLHRGDDDIVGELAKALADPLQAPDEHEVSVTVADGVVTLSGTVLHPMDVPLVHSLAWHTPGVTGVVDELTAREPDPHL